ncbi:MAG TPA: WecB/TagA/CpsF family glycosyltransferase [bacterium]|nr:WecB/TagA/CpsF family glycosyltransferase [bacterium]
MPAETASRRANILGVGVSPIDMDTALDTVDRWIARRRQHYVCVTTVHGVMECQRDQDLRRIHNTAGLVTPDGMPLVWLSRLMGFPHVQRVYGPDLMLALCSHSATRGYRHFFFGGDRDVPDRLTANLQRRFPGLLVAGAYAPPFRPLTADEDDRIVRTINDAAPDIVWVGLGTPKQEYWMARHVGRLRAPVLIGVGAAFDFHAGVKKQAPVWMRGSGLEWMFRLLSEPRRLWSRYLVKGPIFLSLLFLQMLGLKQYRLE